MKQAEKWLEKAGKDLGTARVNLEGQEYEAAAFYSHQAAEKALKALYILKFKRLWKTHDLVGLAASVKATSLLTTCEQLTRHYIETRYPTETEYTEEVSEKALEMAERVVKWVLKKMEK